MTDMLLLAQPERPDPDTWVGPGLLGLAVILAIAVVMVFLWKNMNKQLGKIRVDGEGASGEGDPDRSTPDESAVRGGSSEGSAPTESASTESTPTESAPGEDTPGEEGSSRATPDRGRPLT